jgi:hypothetical protein
MDTGNTGQSSDTGNTKQKTQNENKENTKDGIENLKRGATLIPP